MAATPAAALRAKNATFRFLLNGNFRQQSKMTLELVNLQLSVISSLLGHFLVYYIVTHSAVYCTNTNYFSYTCCALISLFN